MDVVLVGLPGSGKSVVGRRLANRHAASFVDLDERIESAAGRSIPEIFEADGEAAFRALERAAIADLGPADAGLFDGRVNVGIGLKNRHRIELPVRRFCGTGRLKM